MQATLSHNGLTFDNARTYLFAALFAAGNIAMPQLCHLLPYGGPMWLPIYLFTLMAAYKFGWRTGLITAILSPVANHLLTGMPVAAALPMILLKSVALASIAGFAAWRYRRTPVAIVIAVMAWAAVAAAIHAAITGSLAQACDATLLSLPGLALMTAVNALALIKK